MRRGLSIMLSALLTLTLLAGIPSLAEGGCGHVNAEWVVTGTRYYKYNNRQHRRGAWVSEKLHCPDCGRDVTAGDLDAQALFDEAAPLAEQAGEALEILRRSPYGSGAAVIGRVEEASENAKAGELLMKTPLGGVRKLTILQGEGLPRIC
jgi:hypothetical protein